MSTDEIHACSATILDALFPPGAMTVLSLAQAPFVELLPAESRAAAGFAPVRLSEFRHGRYCARRALGRLGLAAFDIPVGRNREPLWPPGVTGSITHAGSAAAAAVAWQSDLASLGIDLEAGSPLETALIPKICRPAEIDRELAAYPCPGETAKLIFSIKEATYKALWPRLRQFLDFHDLEVQLDHGLSRFVVTSHSRRCPPTLLRSLEGRFSRVDGMFAAGAALRAARPA